MLRASYITIQSKIIAEGKKDHLGSLEITWLVTVTTKQIWSTKWVV